MKQALTKEYRLVSANLPDIAKWGLSGEDDVTFPWNKSASPSRNSRAGHISNILGVNIAMTNVRGTQHFEQRRLVDNRGPFD